MNRENRIQQFINEFQMENLTKKYLYKNTWMSGSLTNVFPIMVWKNDVEIQWKSDKKIFDRFIKRIVEKTMIYLSAVIFGKRMVLTHQK